MVTQFLHLRSKVAQRDRKHVKSVMTLTPSPGCLENQLWDLEQVLPWLIICRWNKPILPVIAYTYGPHPQFLDFHLASVRLAAGLNKLWRNPGTNPSYTVRMVHSGPAHLSHLIFLLSPASVLFLKINKLFPTSHSLECSYSSFLFSWFHILL